MIPNKFHRNDRKHGIAYIVIYNLHVSYPIYSQGLQSSARVMASAWG